MEPPFLPVQCPVEAWGSCPDELQWRQRAGKGEQLRGVGDSWRMLEVSLKYPGSWQNSGFAQGFFCRDLQSLQPHWWGLFRSAVQDIHLLRGL